MLRLAVVALSGCTMLWAPRLGAQEPAKSEAPLELERIEVTGSLIPFASTQTALPVTVLDSRALGDSGVTTNLLDVLRKLVPQFSGNGNIGNANAGTTLGLTAGGSMLSLRNVQTLVLVNGRPMAYAPALAAGGLQFVDVNLIPLAAIDRVEVLQDGASATYGTDAVSGVVNIILKTDFRGVEVDARYGVATGPGHFTERSFSLVGGTGNGRTNLTFSAEATHTDPLAQDKRAFATPSYGTSSFAGVINTRTPNTLAQFFVLNPALNAPPAGHTDLATLVAQGVYLPVDAFNLTNGVGPEQQYAFNLASYTKLLQENERRSATLNLEHLLNDRVTLFGDFIYAATHTFTQLNAQPLTPTLTPANSSNPTTQTMMVRNRFVDYPRLYDYDSTSVRGIAGARGTFAADFTWETAANWNVIWQDYRNQNLVDATQSAAAVAQGLLALDAREQAPGAIDASGVFGTAWGRAKSSIATGDARVSGALFDLPAGPLGFALGTEYRVETLQEDSDPNSHSDTLNWQGGVTLDPFHGRRAVWSFFAELRVPVVGPKQDVPAIHALELSAAVRHERYSDSDNPTVPKVALAWRPFGDDFLIRASYSQSFVAPDLFSLFGPASESDGEDTTFTQLGGGQVSRQFNFRDGANPELRPSHSENTTFGLVWSPRAVKGFSLTADYFDITQTDLVASIDEDIIIQDVEDKGPASPYAQFVKVGGFDGAPITAPGQLSADTSGDMYVSLRLVNIANLKLSGADVKAEYFHGIVATGRIDAGVAVAWYDSYTYQLLPSVAPVETVGLATDANGTLPRWQSNATLAWSRGRWRVNLDWQHLPGVGDPKGDGTEMKPFHTRAYDAIDVALGCTLDLHRKWAERLTIRVGVNNVFNEQPPFDGGTYPSTHADTGTYSAIGRLVFVEGKYKF